MKTFFMFICLFVISLIFSSHYAFAYTETTEILRGDRIAQPGPDPVCEPNDRHVCIEITEWSEIGIVTVWDPNVSLCYANASVTTWSASPHSGFYYHITILQGGAVFSASSFTDINNWINIHYPIPAD